MRQKCVLWEGESVMLTTDVEAGRSIFCHLEQHARNLAKALVKVSLHDRVADCVGGVCVAFVIVILIPCVLGCNLGIRLVQISRYYQLVSLAVAVAAFAMLLKVGIHTQHMFTHARLLRAAPSAAAYCQRHITAAVFAMLLK